MIQKLNDFNLEIVLSFFNYNCLEGPTPSVWRLIPIPKNFSPNELNSQCPVSLKSVFGNVIERMILQITIVVRKCLFSKYQIDRFPKYQTGRLLSTKQAGSLSTKQAGFGKGKRIYDQLLRCM